MSTTVLPATRATTWAQTLDRLNVVIGLALGVVLWLMMQVVFLPYLG